MERVYREGHEIGNHTFNHPDISEIPNWQVDLELNLTERLFAAKLGVQPLYFRPPFSIDQEPDTTIRRHRSNVFRAGIRHDRQQDRHERLGRASAQDAERRLPQRL